LISPYQTATWMAKAFPGKWNIVETSDAVRL